MADFLVGIIFVVIFYNVFKFIWTHVTTVSYSGLEGFFKSWGNQVFWSFVITAIIITILAKILDSILDFGRGLNFGFSDVLIFGVVAYVLFAIFSSSDTFDRKTFRENYNRNVIALKKKLDFSTITYFLHECPGNLVLSNDNREEFELTLAEDFISAGSSKLVQIPNMSISHDGDDKFPQIELRLYHKSDPDEGKRMEIWFWEQRFLEIAIGAMIEAVAEGKSRAVENALKLIDKDGDFTLEKFALGKISECDHTEDGIAYTVSSDSSGNFSFKMLKLSSEGK
ncbi:MAG: hypothetical protein IJL14_04630 [Selenomonadaceae bacterium]|nr:hypothetical protein [Selenomonadaceae bacterium]